MDDLRATGDRIQPDAAYRLLHRGEPDYERPLLEPTDEQIERIRGLLDRIYGTEQAESCFDELLRLMQVYYAHKTDEMIEHDRGFDRAERFTEKDVILITYGDLVVSPDEPPLQVLGRLLETYNQNVSAVHILPFFPYSSDRGFSVVDYEEVDPHLGHWEDVEVPLDPLPADVRRCDQPHFGQEPLVPGVPQRQPGLRRLLHRLHQPRGDLGGGPQADPPAADLRRAERVRHAPWHPLRLDDVQPGPDRPELQEPPGAAADARRAPAVRAARCRT